MRGFLAIDRREETRFAIKHLKISISFLKTSKWLTYLKPSKKKSKSGAKLALPIYVAYQHADKINWNIFIF